LLPRFSGRLIPLDAEVMLLWGSLVARLESDGRTMPAIDSLIAASAIYHHLILVTRKATDFAYSGVSLTNPWE
jgi:tRNA(fMet)-specific endonuclease VapC